MRKGLPAVLSKPHGTASFFLEKGIERTSKIIEKDRLAAHMGIEFTHIEDGRAASTLAIISDLMI
ncbi:MAG: hypothetical protein JJE48_09825 [Actinobacteria bacterium]|nr:hypothetical protein [Actinomycetota bacterium]